MSSLETRTLRNIYFIGTSQLVVLFLTLLTVTVLTRILTPDDFGIVSIGLIFVYLFVSVQDFGIAPAVIQRDARVEESIAVGLTLRWILAFLLFLLMVGSSFAVLDKSGILGATIARVVKAFGRRKYALLLVVSFLFMLMGAFFGIFEEVVPLVPVMIALAYFLGWDSLVGLGMSILATNMGFSAAITNPFTVGVAQKIAGLPLFSGAWLRVLIFVAVYAVFAAFLVRYARRVERDPQSSRCSKRTAPGAPGTNRLTWTPSPPGIRDWGGPWHGSSPSFSSSSSCWWPGRSSRPSPSSPSRSWAFCSCWRGWEQG